MEQYKIEDIKNTIIQGDCLEVMKKIPDNSIDTIITDPPYGLEFFGKDWDKFKNGKNIAGGNTGKGTPYARNRPAPSFYQLTNEDKLTFQMFNYEWAKEALRIAKPGATFLCFGGVRTYHRLTCAIEDAGWIIKDCLMWLYCSGFPKGTDIAKQLEKKLGQKTLEAKQWEGWKSGLKPAYEPIVMAMKPNDGTYAENALKWGVSGLNIDGGRIPQFESMDDSAGKGRFPTNIILDEDVAQELGRISRFFYVVKAGRAERNMGCEDLEDKPAGQSLNDSKYTRERMGNTPANKRKPIKNNHPTVKPVRLLEYLCTLTKTPTGGIILDPFVGSGTTCMAAKKVGRDFIGIEKEEEYCVIARARIAAIKPEPTLFQLIE